MGCKGERWELEPEREKRIYPFWDRRVIGSAESFLLEAQEDPNYFCDYSSDSFWVL